MIEHGHRSKVGVATITMAVWTTTWPRPRATHPRREVELPHRIIKVNSPRSDVIVEHDH